MAAILKGKYRLVIITGNAGDGKTAFIKRIEKEASNVERFSNRNGAKFLINGVAYQLQEDRANNEVLSEFFQPFENTSNLAMWAKVELLQSTRAV